MTGGVVTGDATGAGATAAARAAGARVAAGQVAAARVAGWSLLLPGADPNPPAAPALLRGLLTPAPAAADAARVLGRKGLLGKEPATRLALAAAQRALGYPDGARPTPPRRDDVAVVACGDYGNAETVVGLARQVREHGVRAVSPMAAPNASSNVVASTVALWFGFGAANLMLCSGDTSGVQAVAVALRLLRANRASRVVVVGAEPDDPVATALHQGPGRGRLRGCAACLVLEPAGTAPGTPVLVGVDAGADAGAAADAGVDPGPGTVVPVIGAGGADPAALWGHCGAAQPLVSLALAVAAVADGRSDRVAVRCADQTGDEVTGAAATGAEVTGGGRTLWAGRNRPC